MSVCSKSRRMLSGLAVAIAICGAPMAGAVEITPFQQSLAVAAAKDDGLSRFYRERDYRPIWVGDSAEDRARRAAFLSRVEMAELHGLPRGRYEPAILREVMSSVGSERDLGRVEVELSVLFLRFARDMQSGILEPSAADSAIKREAPVRDAATLLAAFVSGTPDGFFDDLAPQSPEYGRLLREKLRLERVVDEGGFGERVPERRIERGATGSSVVAVRDRLIALGYLDLSHSSAFDDEMGHAVEAFQSDHGLVVDGIVGGDTTTELNRSATDRLGHLLVSMERERWMNHELGARHIWVNLTDFSAKIVEDGEVAFQTRSVIGANEADRQTPEFSDEMDHMVINPSWYVPRSIIVNEYLPALRRNPYALSYLEITDSRGRVVNRGRGFSHYTARTFPFSMRQPPSPRNALGLVKFMFPNKYNIYLHDTPAKNLFSRDVRAFSHGCIRLNDPFEFGYALLSAQSDDPVGEFQRHLQSGRETRVNLRTPVPVHLVYRTAISKPEGGMEYRRDVYGRNARVLSALMAAGVALPGAGS